MSLHRLLYALGLLLGLWLTSAILPTEAQDEPNTIVNTATGNEDFSTLVAAILAADSSIVEMLNSEGEFTVFAPNNAAFAALLETLEISAENLLADRQLLNRILPYHVVAGTVFADDIVVALEGSDALYPKTLNGARLTVTANDGVVVINNATVVTADIEASNGMIHVIDRVLLPPGNILDVVSANEEFSIFVAGVQAAGLNLRNTLANPDAELTVFVPTNAAFEATLESLGLTAEELLADSQTLTNILLHHVVVGEVYSGDLVDALSQADSFSADTLIGAPITFSFNENGVFANSANISIVDMVASNGVVHVIDSVLLPSADEPADETETSE